MTIVEVKDARQIRQFLDLPKEIYKNDSHWICPLDKDIEAVFNPKLNRLFEKGECKRWLLLDDSSKPIGRVATFVNPKYKNEIPVGGIGFFEIIQHREAAFFLLDHCKKWLQERGMEAMDGFINFGERDRWWGALTKGYFEPMYGMNYNPPYYIEFLEAYGFQIYFKQLCYGMDVVLNFQDSFFVNHKKVSQIPGVRVEHIKKNELTRFAQDFSNVYNKAWAQHNAGKTISPEQALKIFNSMKAIMDEELCWFAYDDEEAVAFWINIPDLNFYFKHLNGKFGWLQKLKFLWLTKTRKSPKFTGLVFGVIPKWQGKGMDSYLIVESTKRFVPNSRYEKYEMQWIGDFNPRMLKVAESLGADVTRELATYRYLFDRNKEFERHPMV